MAIPVPRGDSVTEVPLTQGQVALIDDEDGPRVLAHKWCAVWNKCTQSFYAARGVWVGDRVRPVKMHRFILGLEWGDPREADHIHHNTLDNRRSELRIVSKAGNANNRRKRRDNSTGYIGVSRRGNRFGASIRIDSRRKVLGCFDTALEASAAYQAAKQEISV